MRIVRGANNPLDAAAVEPAAEPAAATEAEPTVAAPVNDLDKCYFRLY
jgi:hypothetical protein